MRESGPGWGDQIHKIEEAELRLVRHEKRTRLVLILLFVLNAILLALVVGYLWGHPWVQESIQEFAP
ncbi:hypothetical protein [Microvirga sp. TS319]|uniref:hypothetical protein n=1 Tax=Microvirga sp. TS319 TaxID=3241165 RepID=UPI00351A6534